MPRQAAITPNRHLHTTIPAELAARLDLFLWSEVEGRVPQGAYQTFICNAIREFFANRQLDLAPFISNAAPGQHIITASPATLEALLTTLRKES